MRTALVLLSDHDADAPNLGGVATVSKDTDKRGWDHGAFDVGKARAAAGALWVDRPYATGNPDERAFSVQAGLPLGAGAYVQLLNEPDLADEHWQGGPAAFFAWQRAVAAILRSNRLLHGPISGGGDLEAWVDRAWPYGYAVHVYGTYDQMVERLRWYLEHTAGDLYITECNPGAGQKFDLAAWAKDDFRRFLAFCDGQPRVKLVAYFAWRWDRSKSLPSSVDAADCHDLMALLSDPPAAEPAPTPVAPPAPERTSPVKIGLMYRMGADVAEKSLGEMAATCDRIGASIICPKAADGDAMEGGFDSDPVFAVTSVEALGSLRDWFAAYRSDANPRGIAVHPWVTPRGFEPVAEGLLHARIAKLCGTILVDFEDMYAGFWGAKLDGAPIFTSSEEGWLAAILYFKTLRENAPGARIVLQNDHRQPLNRVYDMADLKPYVDAAAPQMYWPWFNESWNATLSEITQINWQGWDLTATIYSSDAKHPADPTGTDECLTHLENVWYSRGPQPVYVFQRVGLTDELGAVLNEHSRLGGAVLADVPGEPVHDGGRTFVAPADDPNGNGGKLIWTDDKGTFKVVDAPPPPPPPAVTILTPLPTGEGTAPPARPVEVASVPGPLEPIDFRAATYAAACSMIFNSIEQIRMLAADASSDDAANDLAGCDRISREMDFVKERHGVRP
jgi:hypothetical protein